NLIYFSIIAASHDCRYRPIDRHELKDIRIQITIPQQPVEIPSIEFYNPETEGLIVKKQDKVGVVLPREAKTSEYALKIGLRNAGIEDKEGITLFKFKAQIFMEGEK
ncbi:MAG: AMMECR1 domain-containing protein, partial [Candidatus Ratteibacteria bacterium]